MKKIIIDDIISAFEEKCAGLRKYSEAIERIDLSVYIENSESVVVKTYGWNIDMLLFTACSCAMILKSFV